MNIRFHKTIGAVGALALATIIGPMAVAWACTSLASVSLTPGAGVTGQRVVGEGYGFGTSHSGSPVEPVEVRWQKADGPVIASVSPDANGNFKFSFVAPQGAPGYYTVIASQKDAKGNYVSGSPARATFALNHPPAQSVPGADAAATSLVEGSAQAPASVVLDPARAGQTAQASPAAALRFHAGLGNIAPAGERSAVAAGPSRGGAPFGGLGLTMMVIGLGALVLAGGTAVAVTGTKKATQRR